MKATEQSPSKDADSPRPPKSNFVRLPRSTSPPSLHLSPTKAGQTSKTVTTHPKALASTVPQLEQDLGYLHVNFHPNARTYQRKPDPSSTVTLSMPPGLFNEPDDSPFNQQPTCKEAPNKSLRRTRETALQKDLRSAQPANPLVNGSTDAVLRSSSPKTYTRVPMQKKGGFSEWNSFTNWSPDVSPPAAQNSDVHYAGPHPAAQQSNVRRFPRPDILRGCPSSQSTLPVHVASSIALPNVQTLQLQQLRQPVGNIGTLQSAPDAPSAALSNPRCSGTVAVTLKQVAGLATRTAPNVQSSSEVRTLFLVPRFTAASVPQHVPSMAGVPPPAHVPSATSSIAKQTPKPSAMPYSASVPEHVPTAVPPAGPSAIDVSQKLHSDNTGAPHSIVRDAEMASAPVPANVCTPGVTDKIFIAVPAAALSAARATTANCHQETRRTFHESSSAARRRALYDTALQPTVSLERLQPYLTEIYEKLPQHTTATEQIAGEAMKERETNVTVARGLLQSKADTRHFSRKREHQEPRMRKRKKEAGDSGEGRTGERRQSSIKTHLKGAHRFKKSRGEKTQAHPPKADPSKATDDCCGTTEDKGSLACVKVENTVCVIPARIIITGGQYMGHEKSKIELVQMAEKGLLNIVVPKAEVLKMSGAKLQEPEEHNHNGASPSLGKPFKEEDKKEVKTGCSGLVPKSEEQFYPILTILPEGRDDLPESKHTELSHEIVSGHMFRKWQKLESIPEDPVKAKRVKEKTRANGKPGPPNDTEPDEQPAPGNLGIPKYLYQLNLQSCESQTASALSKDGLVSMSFCAEQNSKIGLGYNNPSASKIKGEVCMAHPDTIAESCPTEQTHPNTLVSVEVPKPVPSLLGPSSKDPVKVSSYHQAPRRARAGRKSVTNTPQVTRRQLESRTSLEVKAPEGTARHVLPGDHEPSRSDTQTTNVCLGERTHQGGQTILQLPDDVFRELFCTPDPEESSLVGQESLNGGQQQTMVQVENRVSLEDNAPEGIAWDSRNPEPPREGSETMNVSQGEYSQQGDQTTLHLPESVFREFFCTPDPEEINEESSWVEVDEEPEIKVVEVKPATSSDIIAPHLTSHNNEKSVETKNINGHQGMKTVQTNGSVSTPFLKVLEGLCSRCLPFALVCHHSRQLKSTELDSVGTVIGYQECGSSVINIKIPKPVCLQAGSEGEPEVIVLSSDDEA